MPSNSGIRHRRIAGEAYRTVAMMLGLGVLVPATRTASADAPEAPRLEIRRQRPNDHFEDPRLDAAWHDYDAAVSAAAEYIKDSVDREANAAANGDAAIRAYWAEAKAALERDGSMPMHKSCKADVGKCRKDCDDAVDALVGGYQRLIDALVVQKKFNEVRTVKQEMLRVRQPMAKACGGFRAADFGLPEGVTLGAGKVLKAWDRDAVDKFRARGLPPPGVFDGVLLERLDKGHADGLQPNDILLLVDDRLLDEEDDWDDMCERLQADKAVDVTILRLDKKRTKWIEHNLGLKPVLSAKLWLQSAVDEIYPKCCNPKMKPQAVPLAKVLLQLVNVPQKVVESAFDNTSGFFGMLTMAVAAKDDDATIDALRALGAQRIQLMDRLVRETDWGRVETPLDPNKTNGQVLRGAWEAVLRTWFSER